MRLVDKEGERSRMNEETFQRKLAELIAEIATLPAGEREKLELLAAQTRERHKQLKETVSSLQESIRSRFRRGKGSQARPARTGDLDLACPRVAIRASPRLDHPRACFL